MTEFIESNKGNLGTLPVKDIFFIFKMREFYFRPGREAPFIKRFIGLASRMRIKVIRSIPKAPGILNLWICFSENYTAIIRIFDMPERLHEICIGLAASSASSSAGNVSR